MNELERKLERRKQNALERLGTNRPICYLCAEQDWRCLENHHIAGRAYDDAVALICRNCHRKLSDSQKDHPTSIDPTSTMLEAIGHFLLGLADFFLMLVGKLQEFGGLLIGEAGKNLNPPT